MTACVNYPERWRKPPLIANAWARGSVYAGAALFVALCVASVEVNWLRVYEGLERGARFVAAFLRPDFVSRGDEIRAGLLESLTITVTATAAGILVSILLGLGAARNLAPLPVYLVCRAVVALARTFHEVLIAIFFVAAFGFGPFAGFLTITFATVGFFAKLLAEDIEDIDPKQAEAVHATGASFAQFLNYGVQPQVTPRLIGLSLYRLDINFRESAVIGIVGAGGVGATLNTAMDRYEYDSAAAIMLVIIVIVMATEYASSIIRRRVQ